MTAPIWLQVEGIEYMTDQQNTIVEEWFYRNCDKTETWAQISLDELRTLCDQVIECEDEDEERRRLGKYI
jgi:hypothetical protein